MTEFGLALAGVGLVGHLIADSRRSTLRAPLKLVASSGFLVVALSRDAAASPYGAWILVGLALSWVGDAALLGRSDRSFLLGLGAFLLGHAAYVGAFLATGLEPSAPTVILAIAWLAAAVAVVQWLRGRIEGPMWNAVLAYIVVISSMVVLSGPAGASRASLLVPAGAIAFAVSDIAVARNRFVSPGFANRLWGLPLYYLGQTLLALSI